MQRVAVLRLRDQALNGDQRASSDPQVGPALGTQPQRRLRGAGSPEQALPDLCCPSLVALLVALPRTEVTAWRAAPSCVLSSTGVGRVVDLHSPPDSTAATAPRVGSPRVEVGVALQVQEVLRELAETAAPVSF